ncbi:hypothetical protein SRHO_G00305520 [Serrasalmus rhombeus]
MTAVETTSSFVLILNWAPFTLKLYLTGRRKDHTCWR